MAKKALVLLSGGLDSATTLAYVIDQGFEAYTISFDYSAKRNNTQELEAAKIVSKTLGAKDHKILKIDMRAIGGSALTSDIEVPKNSDIENEEIPITYVPARNTIFLSLALAYAETLKIYDIFYGANIIDYSHYPDCRPEFIEAFEKVANLGTAYAQEAGRNIKIHAPLTTKSKAEIIALGNSLGLDYSITSSCYDPLPDSKMCGACNSCQIRLKGFSELGLKDPAQYA